MGGGRIDPSRLRRFGSAPDPCYNAAAMALSRAEFRRNRVY
jgi:hypothetical protein